MLLLNNIAPYLRIEFLNAITLWLYNELHGSQLLRTGDSAQNPWRGTLSEMGMFQPSVRLRCSLIGEISELP